MNFPILCISYKWNLQYVIFMSGFFHSAKFSRFIHAVARIRTPSFSVAEYFFKSLYILLIHSQTDGHLGCFYLSLLWIVLWWTSVHKYLFEYLFSIILSIYTEVCIDKSYRNSTFNFLTNWQPFSTDKHFSQRLHRFSFLPPMYKGFNLFISSQTLFTFQMMMMMMMIAILAGMK